MAAPDHDDVGNGGQMNADDVATLRALQVRMMSGDIAAERGDKGATRKRLQFANFVERAAPIVVASDLVRGFLFPEGDAGTVDADRIIAVAPTLAAEVVDRSRAAMILVELMTFDPWVDGLRWNKTAHAAALSEVAGELPGVTPTDFTVLTTEFDSLMKQLRRKSIRWRRVAVVTVVGLGAGALTGGAVAPAVGAALGATFGLSGAAATSAGLAALGGGSLATGGLGIFGGTLVVAGLGGAAAGGVAGAGARYSRFGKSSIAADAIKLDLMAALLLAHTEDRDRKMRRVAENLNQIINDLSKKANLLSERIAQLKEANRAQNDEITRLRGTVNRLGADLAQRDSEMSRLRAELAETRTDIATVGVVLDRWEPRGT